MHVHVYFLRKKKILVVKLLSQKGMEIFTF